MPVINIFEQGAQLGAPANRTSNVRIENSGQMANIRQQAATANILQTGADKYYEQLVNADVMKANSEYNTRLTQLRNELFQNKEENALNNMQKFEEGRQKILTDILKNGPQSLRYGRGNMLFIGMAEKDWDTKRSQMQMYQIGEAEKYQDTVYNSNLATTLSDITAGYISDADLQNAMAKNGFLAEGRYRNYGNEKIAFETRKANGNLVQTAVQTAIIKDDFTRASEIMQGYGNLLDANKRLVLDKAITERIKNDNEVTEFERIYVESDGNIEKAQSMLENSSYDPKAGIDYAKEQEGNYLGVNQCANFVSETIKRSGGDLDLISSLADGMYRNAEAKGMTFTERSQLRDGDIVYWQVTGSGYSPSNDPAAVESDTYAYKGITHVGVYDAATGKVIQSGNNGVAAIGIDTYNVVGFSHVGKKGLSPSEKIEKKNRMLQYFANKETVKRKIADQRFDNWKQQIKGWRDSGISFEDALKQAENFAGADPDLMSSAMTAVKNVYWEFGSGRGRGFSNNVKADLAEALRQNKFNNKEEFEEFVLSLNPTSTEYKNAMNTYDDWDKRKGEFAFNFKNIKKEVMAGINLKDAEYNAAWNEARAAGVAFIKEWEAKNGYAPSEYEVIAAAKNGMIRDYYGSYSAPGDIFQSDLNISEGQRLRAGIRSIKRIADDIYEVQFMDGRPVQAMGGYSLNRLVGNEE